VTLNKEVEKERIKSFKVFYPYYLSEHRNPINRALHFVGSLIALIFIGVAITEEGRSLFFLYAVLVGYAFAWVGHFFIEKNRPATFTYPFYSLMGDWRMFFELLLRKRAFNEKTIKD
jgi:hypothetical protein